MATTDEQVSQMRGMCEALPSALIKTARVDDWGRFGNFQVLVTPFTHDRSTTTRLKAAVRRHLPAGAHVRECFGPDPVYKRGWDGQKTLTGYSRTYWVFDIDYQHYCESSNSFRALSTPSACASI